jgi:hypothetical protein
MTEAEALAEICRLICNQQWRPKSTNFGPATNSQDMEHEPILQMGTDKMIPNMHITCQSQSSSLTSVNGRMGSPQTKKGTWSGTWMGPRPIKALVLGCIGEASGWA